MSEEICSYIFLSDLITKSVLDVTIIFSLFLDPPLLLPLPPFILPSPLILALHVHARWLVLILVPSAPSIILV